MIITMERKALIENSSRVIFCTFKKSQIYDHGICQVKFHHWVYIKGKVSRIIYLLLILSFSHILKREDLILAGYRLLNNSSNLREKHSLKFS